MPPTALDFQLLGEKLSHLSQSSSQELLAGYQLLSSGFPTIEQACPDPERVRDAMSNVMSSFVQTFADADCVFVRKLNVDGSLEVVGKPVWRQGAERGSPPHTKQKGEGISAWAIENSIGKPLVVPDVNDPGLNSSIREAHLRILTQGKLSESESEFVEFVRAEACVPLLIHGQPVGVIVAVRGDVYEASQAARVRALLEEFKGFLRSLFLVGWVLHDFHRSNHRMKRLSRVHQVISNTKNNELFFRQAVTVLTSHCGLGWHRAMVFVFDRTYPSDARCVMAVGGLGEEHWPQKHTKLASLSSLDEFLSLCESPEFAEDDQLYQLCANLDSPVIIDQSHFERNVGLNELLSAKSTQSAVAEDGVWYFTSDDAWPMSVSHLAPAFSGLAANCEHVLIPLNWIEPAKDGFSFHTPGFVLLDNPYVRSQDLSSQLPLTRMFCNFLSGLVSARYSSAETKLSRHGANQRELSVSELDLTGLECSGSIRPVSPIKLMQEASISHREDPGDWKDRMSKERSVEDFGGSESVWSKFQELIGETESRRNPHWVAFHNTTPIASATTKIELYARCNELGLPHGEIVVCHVTPSEIPDAVTQRRQEIAKTLYAPSSSVVHILRQYGAVHVDFLAKKLDCRRCEISDTLDDLQSRGVICHEDDQVSLVQNVLKRQLN